MIVPPGLRRAGVAERDIQTSGLNLSAQYDYVQNEPPKLRGYQAVNRVTVECRRMGGAFGGKETQPALFAAAAAVLAVCCLGATDSGAIEDLLVALGHSIRGRLSHLLQFEVAVSTLVTLLGFGLVTGH